MLDGIKERASGFFVHRDLLRHHPEGIVLLHVDKRETVFRRRRSELDLRHSLDELFVAIDFSNLDVSANIRRRSA